MNEMAQFYTLIGIMLTLFPSTIIVMIYLMTSLKDDINARFDDLNARFDDMNNRIDEVRNDYKTLNNKVDTLFAQVNRIEGALILPRTGTKN